LKVEEKKEKEAAKVLKVDELGSGGFLSGL
jgi:hypothetical protein